MDIASTEARTGLARPNWIEVDLSAIAHNVKVLRAHVGPGVRIVSAVKANGYGLGLIEVARTIEGAGGDAVAVVGVEDAVRMREAGIRIPILLFGGNLATPEVVAAIERHDLIGTVSDREGAEGFARLARSKVRVFVEMNAGGERLGVSPAEAPELVAWMRQRPNIEIAGIYTHPGIPGTARAVECVEWEFRRFMEAVDEIDRAGPPIPLRMIASSGILAIGRHTILSAVDPGNLVYGLAPPGPGGIPFDTRPALLALKSRLVHTHAVDRPDFVAESPIPIRSGMRIGVFPMGTSDRLRDFNKGYVLVRGRRAAILGKLSAEHAKVDLTDIAGAAVGDEVVIIGRQGGESITVDDIAAHHHVSLAEIVQGLPATLARVYV